MAGLPRELVKWIQSLDLSSQIKVPKWDLQNGFLIAEIFSRYFPQNISAGWFINGSSVDVKQENWRMIKEFIKAKGLEVPVQHMEGTMHGKERAAAHLLECLFKLLTGREVHAMPTVAGQDDTDFPYQVKLAPYARCTASTSVKANLRLSEMLCDDNFGTIAKKSEKIISAHMKHQRQQRQEDPKRFNVKPTLAERCARRLPTPEPEVVEVPNNPSADSGHRNSDSSKFDLSDIFG